MEFTSLEEILDFAIGKEQEAADFYRLVSRRENPDDRRRMFLDFAAEEEKHASLLQALKTGEGQFELMDYRWKWITDIKRSNYVLEMDYHPQMSYRDILLLAAKREEKALAFYNDCLRGADNPEAQTLFKMLCQEEARHKLALEGMLDDYMAEMGD